MKSNNKPDSLVAACFGTVASFLIIAALSGCGGGAGSGGIDSGEGTDTANGTVSADGNTFTISSFKKGLEDGTTKFSMIENVSTGAIAASSANVTATLDTDVAHATQGNRSVDVNFKAMATDALGLKVDSSGLSDWTPYRYVHFDVKTGASAFNGKVVVQSKATWIGCEASGSVAANSTGTLTLDMNTCSAANLDKTLVQRLQLQIDSGTAAGHFYVDNVRLEKGTPPPVVTDIADATTSPDGNTFTVSSFASGFGGFSLIENTGTGPIAANAANGAATADSVAAHATDGTHSVDVNFIANPPTSGHELGLAIEGNAGVADWTAIRYVRFDVTTGAIPFDGSVIVQSKSSPTSWSGWCQASGSVPANTKGTLTLDMNNCSLYGNTFYPTEVFRLWLRIESSTAAGHFYIDNVRLEKGAPAPVPVDIADATTSADGNTFTVSSFAGGLGGFSLIENTSTGAIAAQATDGAATVDSVAAHATDGTHSVDVNLIAFPANGNWLGLAIEGNAGVSDWTAFRYVRFDVKTGAIPFDGTVIVQSKSSPTSWSGWCQTATETVAANSTATLTLDMNNCSLYGNTFFPTEVYRLALRIESTTAAGHFYIDNVRLTKN